MGNGARKLVGQCAVDQDNGELWLSMSKECDLSENIEAKNKKEKHNSLLNDCFALGKISQLSQKESEVSTATVLVIPVRETNENI